jgi:hypothetical protein
VTEDTEQPSSNFLEADALEDEWFVLSPALLKERPKIAEAVEAFEGDPRFEVSTEGARWLKRAAAYERACLTRLLFIGDRLAGFYALASAEVRITRGKELERLETLGGERVPASHIEWLLRSEDFKGIGEKLLLHATLVARDVARAQGNLVLTLDPYDSATARMWRGFGFEKSATRLEEGLRRMYLPVFGYRSFVKGRE